MHKQFHRGIAALLIGAGAAFGLTDAAGATGTTQVLHRYAVFEWQHFEDPATGAPIASVNNLRPGDRVEFADIEYVGSSRHHSTAPIGSDHGLCTISAKGVPVCQLEMAQGGSMLLGRGNLTQSPTGLDSIYAGTGAFAGVKSGTVEVVNIDPNSQTSNSNLTFSLQY